MIILFNFKCTIFQSMIRYALNFSISIRFAESVQSVSCQIYDHIFICNIILYILMYNNKYVRTHYYEYTSSISVGTPAGPI